MNKPRTRATAALVVVASALVPFAFAIRVIASGDITSLISRGAQAKTDAFFAFDAPEVARRNDVGHDGAQFYVIARTFPNLDDAAEYLDRPSYRLRRILLPVVASPLGPGRTYALGVLLLNLAAAAATVAALLQIARRARLPLWAATGFALSPGILLAVQLSLSDVLAVSLAAWAIAIADRNVLLSVTLCICAAFARETALLAALALLILTRRSWYLLPFVAVGTWSLFLIDRFGGTDVQEFGPPFVSWFRFGVGHGLVIASLAAGELWAAWVIRHRVRPLALWTLGEAVMLIFVSAAVSFEGNVARAVPIATTAMTFGMATLAASRSSRNVPALDQAGYR